MSFSPTPTEIEQVREIAQLVSVPETATLISALTDEQWERTLADIQAWESVRDDGVEVVGGLLGANISAEAARIRICNRVRIRLGLSSLSATGNEVRRSVSVPINVNW